MYCKHCKKEVGYYIHGSIEGTAEEIFTSDGNHEDTSVDWDWYDRATYCIICDNEIEK